MGLNRMLFKNGNKDDFILYLDRTIETVKDDNIDSVGVYAFDGCSSLTSIDLPNATSIGSYAFYLCSSLTSIDLPNATSIGEYSFGDCSSLTSIDLPNATSISSYAFDGCSSLTSIHFSAKNKEIIEKLSGYSSVFGSTNATIYFDL